MVNQWLAGSALIAEDMAAASAAAAANRLCMLLLVRRGRAQDGAALVVRKDRPVRRELAGNDHVGSFVALIVILVAEREWQRCGLPRLPCAIEPELEGALKRRYRNVVTPVQLQVPSALDGHVGQTRIVLHQEVRDLEQDLAHGLELAAMQQVGSRLDEGGGGPQGAKVVKKLRIVCKSLVCGVEGK